MNQEAHSPLFAFLTTPLLGVGCLLLSTGAFANGPNGESVTYEVDDESFQGYYASPEEEAKGTVLIIHDWDGLTEYEQLRAEMLAEQGYAAFAVDLYGKDNRPESMDARKAEMEKLYEDRERMRQLTLAGLEQAREKGVPDNTVIMGYCFGGAVVLEMARSADAEGIHGYTSFHGSLDTPEGQEWPDEIAPILIAHGGADESVTMDDVATLAEELEAADATYEIQVYSGAPHAFTVYDGDRYQERADKKSWSAFLDFLDKTL
ncbi:dienelactone hydrolase family protein [Aidingimonas halophila]|uniref:Dienelactone hydrolase n=1 Tax=Aidingimonas halophila TaxID=574349 RepID=A0A1H3FML1_9GAMM|nr:dienelactone hydrolase family protein [Aidingimonas halophila]GHC38152.1 dienelactone hydrolase [Aidingimonas halophila]SDX92125.1 Dienelactone hydrolase [Aidingimonas halophila]